MFLELSDFCNISIFNFSNFRRTICSLNNIKKLLKKDWVKKLEINSKMEKKKKITEYYVGSTKNRMKA